MGQFYVFNIDFAPYALLPTFPTLRPMSDNYQQEKEKKQAIIALLLQMSSADKSIVVREQKYIYDVAAYIGLTPSDIQSVKDQPEQYAFSPPKEEPERMNILYFLLFAMSIDGVIKEPEEHLCYKVGLRLGFNEQMTADLIAVMKRYLNKKMPPDALISEVKKYMN